MRGARWRGGGASLDTVFTQRRNLASPAFLRMLRDILRFNSEAGALAVSASLPGIALGAFLNRHRYSREFRDWYLLPMAACIWSCPASQMLEFPLATFVRFCDNHGLLQVNDRPQWRTVKGGSRRYIEKMLAEIPQKRLACPVQSVTRNTLGGARAVRLDTAAGAEHFDEVVPACHSDQSLALLGDLRPAEQTLLSGVRQLRPGRCRPPARPEPARRV